MSMTEGTRERFERWAATEYAEIAKHGLLFERNVDGRYSLTELRGAWAAWQAATEGEAELREALENVLGVLDCVHAGPETARALNAVKKEARAVLGKKYGAT